MVFKPFLFTISLVLISTLFSCSKVHTTTIVSRTINLNKGWEFKRELSENNFAETQEGKSGSDLVLNEEALAADWQLVNLPHTPKIEPLVVNNQWQGVSWYQKSLALEPEWRNNKIFIRFEAAMNHAEVWINDQKIGEHLGGYLPFTLDISEAVNFEGENVVKVKLTNIDNPIIGPKPLKKLDFNTYGGLYRDVSLFIKSPLHITDEMHASKVASGGVFVTFPKIDTEESIVNVKTHIANQYANKKAFILKQSLYFGDDLVSQTEGNITELLAFSDKQFSQDLVVNNAKLWSPKTPNLYQLVSEIYLDNKLIEQKQTRIGLRKFEFNAQHQLLINGEITFLRGVNRHQEYPHVGYATSHQADYRDAVKIKSAGFDYVRLSHYPHSKAFMDAADELGLVLIDAILGWQYYLENPDFKAQIIRTCKDLIRRDRNHASVLAWECSLNESWMPEEFIADLHATVKQEMTNGFSAGWQLGYDLYLQARQHRQKHYVTPTQPYNVSEYGDWEYYAQNAGLNQDSWADLKEEDRTSRQLLSSGEARLLQQARNLQEAHNDNLTTPAFADGYWVMFDYNRGYADDLESSGIMSIHRLPKYSYYFYQSQRDASEYSPLFTSGPMVFIASEWTKNSSTLVRVFSNAEEVELWLNGSLISRNKPTENKYSTKLPHPPFEFDLGNFNQGQLLAKAFIDGELVAEHQVVTPQAPHSIKLTIDESGKPAETGVNDVLFAYAELLDEQGNNVPLNGEKIAFTSTGNIEIIHTNVVKTEQGKAAVLLRIGDSLLDTTIQASAPALNIQSKSVNLSPKVGAKL
jgi:beta-galactosidase